MFVYYGKNKEINDAVAMANAKFGSILKRLASRKKDFKESNLNGPTLANLFLHFQEEPLEVKTYWYWSRNVNGKFEPRHPDKMWINTRSRIFSSVNLGKLLVSLMYHERTHFLDLLSQSFFFHHGTGPSANHYSLWKEETAPYFVDRMAENACEDSATELPKERDKATKIKTVDPLWKRIVFFWRYL